MKTHVKFWIAAMLLVATSCSEKMDEQNRNNGSSPDTGQAYTRTLDEAVLYAQSMFDQNGVTRAGGLALADYKIYNAASATRSGDGEEASFYVLNFTDNGGYAIVPTDNRTTPVYAYSTTGNIDIDEAVENTGFGVFMENAVEYCNYEMSTCPILLPGDGRVPNPTDERALYPLTEYNGKMYHTKMVDYCSTIAPKTTTLWDQWGPYYNSTPMKNGEHSLAGCAPIAMAQIMAYYEHPTKCGDYTLDWGQIKSKATVVGSESYADAVAYFIRDIGRTAGTEYDIYPNGSSTSTSKIVPTLKHYGYSTGSLQSYSISAISASLNNGYLVYGRGENRKGEGHAWVIDGYERYSTTYWYYYTTPPYDLYKTVPNCNVKEYVNCNWGWGGGYKTECLSGVFEASDSPNDSFCNDNKIVPNIHL